MFSWLDPTLTEKQAIKLEILNLESSLNCDKYNTVISVNSYIISPFPKI